MRRPVTESIRLIACVAGLLVAACAREVVVPPPESGSLELTRVAELALGSPAIAITISDRVAYVALASGGISVVDVSEPRAPEALTRLDAVRADALGFSEDRVFALARGRALEL